jgi:hypothetical protein
MVEFALTKKKRTAVETPVGHLADTEFAPLLLTHAFGLGPHLRDDDVHDVLEIVGAGTDHIARAHRRMQLERAERHADIGQCRIAAQAHGLGDALQNRKIALPGIEHRQGGAIAMKIEPLAPQERIQGLEGERALIDDQSTEGLAACRRKSTQFE